MLLVNFSSKSAVYINCIILMLNTACLILISQNFSSPILISTKIDSDKIYFLISLW